jgi:hypothetical protein
MAVSAMCVRALRIAVLKSAGNFTRDECHDLNAEKIQRVKCFMFTRCGICCVLVIFERERSRLGSKISGYGQLGGSTVCFVISGLPREADANREESACRLGFISRQSASPSGCPLFSRKRTSEARTAVSALGQFRNSCTAAKSVLFDHLIGAREQGWRHFQSERPGRLEVDDHLEFRWLHDGEITGLLTLENAAGIDACVAIQVG